MKLRQMRRGCFLGVLMMVACGGGTDGGSAVSDSANTPDGGAADTTGVPPSDTSTPPPQDTNGPPPATGPVDPNCIDGQYNETLPPYSTDISALVNSYSSSNYMGFIDSVLATRYPVGQYLVNQALTNSTSGNCIDYFLSQKNTAKQIISQMSTFVHECGHFADIAAGGFGFGGSEDAYLISKSLTLKCTQGAGPFNGGPTFARSLLTSDEYAALWPACAGFGGGSNCDFYGNVYLNGDPNNSKFEGGDQGFGSVMEEATQYVNSLATGFAFQDFVGFSVSERDGIATFLFYIQRYLRMARLQYPQAYTVITNDCWREVILTVWGRAWLFLEATKNIKKLGIADAKILDLVMRPELLEEIERVRDLEGCP